MEKWEGGYSGISGCWLLPSPLSSNPYSTSTDLFLTHIPL